MKNNKRLRLCMCVLVLVVTCVYTACSENNEEVNLPSTGLDDPHYIFNMPSIEAFSGTILEDYEYQFSPVKSAVLMQGNTKTEISPDDPRLIRLLNSFAYADSNSMTNWLQGYVYEDEVTEYLSCDEVMLEVTFYNNKDSMQCIEQSAAKMVVCGDSCIFLTDTQEEVLAIRHWPYGGLYGVPHDESSCSDMSWGGKYWIDFLVYAGFKTDEGVIQP